MIFNCHPSLLKIPRRVRPLFGLFLFLYTKVRGISQSCLVPIAPQILPQVSVVCKSGEPKKSGEKQLAANELARCHHYISYHGCPWVSPQPGFKGLSHLFPALFKQGRPYCELKSAAFQTVGTNLNSNPFFITSIQAFPHQSCRIYAPYLPGSEIAPLYLKKSPPSVLPFPLS